MADRSAAPQALDAEESVIGAMLISKLAVDTVSEIGLTGRDFYRPSHGLVFDACMALYGDDKPVDAITVADKLAEQGRLEEAGGAVRVHELSALVPAAANAAHYANIVREHAVYRGLIDGGQMIAQLGFERGGDLPELIDRAEKIVFDLALSGRTSDFVPVSEPLAETFARIDEIQKAGARIVGLPSGFEKLDDLTSGFQPGNLIVLAARPSMGKRLRLDAPILTPHGWRRNDELSPGDVVTGADGRPDTVVAVYDEPEPLDFFRVTFADGVKVECCGEHLWLTRTTADRRAGRPGRARTTAEIAATLHRPDSHGWNHSVPYVEPVEFVATEPLSLDSYWLGLYLGDGHSGDGSVRFSNPEPDLQEAFIGLALQGDVAGATDRLGSCPTLTIKRRKRNNKRSATLLALVELGLDRKRSEEKFVPDHYLRASTDDRIALLQGLCDTDGYVTDPAGACVEYSTASPFLRDAVVFLVRSLGGRATYTSRPTHYMKDGTRHEARESHRVVLSFPRGGVTPVRSQKHLAKWRGGPHRRSRERAIVSVEPCGRFPGRCITVGRGLYVTDGFTVTHNTGMALNIAAHVAVGLGKPVGLFTLEMSRAEVTQRLLSAEALVDSRKIRNGTVSGDDWSRMTAAAGRLHLAPLQIDDSGTLTIMEIRAKARRLKLRFPGLALVVVDYLQLMSSGSKNADVNRVQDISQISRGLKVLAADLNVPVLALSQLSRGVEQRHDKRPILSDLRESGSIEQDADLVLFIYRDEYYNPEDTDQQGIAEVNIAKHRNGPTGMAKLAFVARYTRFNNLASEAVNKSVGDGDKPPAPD